MCIVYLAVEGQKGREEVYRSKLPRGDFDPQLKEMVRLPFKFEERQNLVFEVYKGYSDCDAPSQDDLRGTLQTPLATVSTKGKVTSSLCTRYELDGALWTFPECKRHLSRTRTKSERLLLTRTLPVRAISPQQGGVVTQMMMNQYQRRQVVFPLRSA